MHIRWSLLWLGSLFFYQWSLVCHEVAALFLSFSFSSSAVVCRQVMQRRTLMVFSECELPIASSAVKPLPSLGTTVLHLTNTILERQNSEQTCSLRESKSNCQYGMDINFSQLTQKEHKWPSGAARWNAAGWLTLEQESNFSNVLFFSRAWNILNLIRNANKPAGTLQALPWIPGGGGCCRRDFLPGRTSCSPK